MIKQPELQDEIRDHQMDKAKVYVLTETVPNYSCEYGCDKERIVGVFTSYDKMDEYIKNHPTASWAFHDYQEFELN